MTGAALSPRPGARPLLGALQPGAGGDPQPSPAGLLFWCRRLGVPVPWRWGAGLRPSCPGTLAGHGQLPTHHPGSAWSLSQGNVHPEQGMLGPAPVTPLPQGMGKCRSPVGLCRAPSPCPPAAGLGTVDAGQVGGSCQAARSQVVPSSAPAVLSVVIRLGSRRDTRSGVGYAG